MLTNKLKIVKRELLDKKNLKKFFYFALVGGFGTILNTIILFLLTANTEIHYLMASAIATEFAIISNFFGNNYLTFKNQNIKKSIFKKFLSFQLISLTTVIGTMFILWLLVNLFGKEFLLIWNVIAILTMFLANYILNSIFTWKNKNRIGLKNSQEPYFEEYIDEKNRASNSNLKNSRNNIFSTSILFIGLFLLVLFSTQVYAANETINVTTEINTTINATMNATINSTINTTINTTINLTTNSSINTTINLTTNVTTNITTNATTNVTTNTTTNITTNVTTNTTTNTSSVGRVIAISQAGYHPSSIKQVVIYTQATSGTFTIKNSNNNAVVATYNLQKPKNFDNIQVNCQGNMACLVGDFTSFTTAGSYYIEESGVKSPVFTINQNMFSNQIPIYFEFFNALLQQNSAYHADLHSGQNPPFTSMSDGSFIMEADQAALSLIRLGSAYRRNPQLFQFNKYDVLSSGKPDVQEYIVSYVKFLEGLQGISMQDSTSPNAVRTGSGMLINNVFVPGPTSLTSMNIYIPGNTPVLLQSAPVVSLCGPNDSSARWQTCISNAANFYKCQIDEPCLNISYNDRRSIITINPVANGYDVSKGWGYEFGCYFDVDLNNGNFNNGAVNPCQIFHEESNRYYTTVTLLAYLEAFPAVNDYSAVLGQELLTRSINTKNFINAQYPAFTIEQNDSGFYGTAMFLLYDYTNNTAYLQEAYNMRSKVNTNLISDMTRGNEFYFEEYIRHKNAMTSLGLTYQINGINPEEYFRGKMYKDYKDSGAISISNNGERMFQIDPNIQFQNSRYILTEGLMAAKTHELIANPEPFIKVIAHNQLSWLTGMNLIQQEVSLNSPTASMSFIFGIGNYPEEFHSRLIANTGNLQESGGQVVGVRGTGYQFFDSTSNSYVYLDGTTRILGSSLGAIGNGWHNEALETQLKPGTQFKNGLDYIPGWINGPFQTSADGDTIYNYVDTVETYEFTESTNEIVATAIEYYAYLDGALNNKPRHSLSSFIIVNTTNTNTTIPPTNSTNNTTGNSSNVTVGNVRVLSNSTSLQFNPNLGPNAQYFMREDANATFLIVLNNTGTINWFVDGISQSSTTTANSLFSWSPGILSIPKPPTYSNKEIFVVSAVVESQTITWKVQVEDIINPFFSSENDGGDVLGSVDAKVHIITNNAYLNFTSLNITMVSDSGSSVFQLNKQSISQNETDWSVYIPQTTIGNNYLRTITGFNNITGFVVNYDVGLSRAHYRNNPASSSSDNSRSSRGGSGGSGGSSNPSNPEVVYVLFERDIVSVDETQTITLDAKNFNGGISSVEAEILSPDGEIVKVELDFISGTEEYGTWSTEFSNFNRGEYVLQAINLGTDVSAGIKKILIQDHQFYYSGEEIGALPQAQSNLELIYTTLSSDEVDAGETVTITIDARDSSVDGVLSATAQVVSFRAETILVEMSLVQGSNQYGTWSGTFIANSPDTTYTVKTITLKNGAGNVDHEVDDRSVYVKQTPQQLSEENLITGDVTLSPFSGEYFIQAMKNPLGPVILGFTLMFFLAGAILFANRRVRA